MKCARILLVSLFILVGCSANATNEAFDAEGVSRITAWLRQENVDPKASYNVAIPVPNATLGLTAPVIVLYDYDAVMRWVSIKGPPVELAVDHDDEVILLRCRIGVVVEVEQQEPFSVRPTPGGTECKQWGAGQTLVPLTGSVPKPVRSLREQMDAIALRLFRAVVALSHPPP